MDIKNKCGISRFKSYEINNQSIYEWNLINERWEDLGMKSENEELILESRFFFVNCFWLLEKTEKVLICLSVLKRTDKINILLFVGFLMFKKDRFLQNGH